MHQPERKLNEPRHPNTDKEGWGHGCVLLTGRFEPDLVSLVRTLQRALAGADRCKTGENPSAWLWLASQLRRFSQRQGPRLGIVVGRTTTCRSILKLMGV